jgi:hypothetical protein
MKPILRVLSILLVLSGGAALIAWPTLAQEPIYLNAVEPPEGLPGQELHLTVWGSGFDELREAGVWLVIADVEVFGVRIESDEAILADISIPENAPPGPRPVEVVVLGREGEVVAGLDEGFFVLEQGPQPALFVDGVEPQQVQQGSQVELNVFGGGFAPGAQVEIEGEGVRVDGVEFISSEYVVAFTEVEDGAPTGWRAVVVINPDGPAGERQNALEVVGEAPPPGPSPTSVPPVAPTPAPTPPPEDGTPLWPWVGGTVVALGAGAAIGRALTLRTRLTWKRTAQAQWQVEAETELPDAKKVCTWACKAKVTDDLLKGWRVTGLELTPYPQPGGKTPAAKRIVGEILDPLTEAAQRQRVAEDEDQTRQRIRQVAEALLEQILAWEGEEQTPASIRVDARLAKEIKTQFKLYHCEQVGPKPDWVDSGIKWTGKFHRPGGECLGVLRGPTAGEPDFASRARQELEDLLVQLVKSVRFKV